MPAARAALARASTEEASRTSRLTAAAISGRSGVSGSTIWSLGWLKMLVMAEPTCLTGSAQPLPT